MEQDWEDYEYKKKNGISVSMADCICYVAYSREIYNLGSSIFIEGRTWIIWKIQTYLKGNELLHTYYLMNKKGLQIPDIFNEKLIGLTLLGRVMQVKGETVQISLEMDENSESTGCCWFQYSTVYSSPDGTGWYCMPEVGDAVRLYFPTEDESNAYAISGMHEDDGSGVRADPNQKIWRNKDGKEIRLAPDRILLTNNNGMFVELNDRKGIRIDSNKSVTVTASETISINSNHAGIELNASNRIVLNQGDSKMVLGNGIHMEGAKIKLE